MACISAKKNLRRKNTSADDLFRLPIDYSGKQQMKPSAIDFQNLAKNENPMLTSGRIMILHALRRRPQPSKFMEDSESAHEKP
jgi:hypothetical protein